jgi:hypothetical protein
VTIEVVPLDLDLDPVAVGFNLRLENIWVRLPTGAVLAVRYQTPGRELRIVQGTRAAVASRLRRAGYKVLTGRPAPWPTEVRS